MSSYRDSKGRRLDEYPHPSVAVDTAVLTVDDQRRLAVVLAGDTGAARRLPGTFLHEGEVLADAVRRALREKVGIEGLRPEQLHVFDRPGRDDRGWVLSVAHVDVVPFDQLSAASAVHLVPVNEASDLKYDHDEIVRRAVQWLRAEYRHQPDPRHLLREPFTLRDLQRMHEAVCGRDLPRDTFRRGMEPKLRPTGRLTSGVVGKPARLWERLG